MSMTPPSTDLPRRSFVHRKLLAHGARFVEINDGLVALQYGELDESTAAARLGLADLCVLPRTGFKGRKVLPALEAQGVELTVPNQAIRQADRGIAAVLAMTEVLILAPLSADASRIQALERGWSLDRADGWYPAPRQDSHFWFALTGEIASATLAKLCGVDLRLNRFADLSVAQTSVARTSCVVIRGDLGDLPAFHLLGDSAAASYLWDCLLDAMAEFGGKPVGVAVLQRAEGSRVASCGA
jgi:sarcosine oxidase, subunit gamma